MSGEWTEIGIRVGSCDIDTAAAIAQMTVPYGVYIEDYSDMLEMVPEIAHIDLIDEELLARSKTEGIVHLYISPDQNPAEAVSFLTARLQAEGISHSIDTRGVHVEDWANAWKAFYHPTPLGRRLVVCPTWEDYTPGPEELLIRLDPGMAFGSGTHHTTRLCCALLEDTVSPGCTVLDMGTGSGILSIASLLLGASRAVGVDIDPVAVRTAAENAAGNGLGPERFTALVGDLVRDPHLEAALAGDYDIVAANIVADVIIALAPAISRLLVPGGALVASGIILPRREETLAALEGSGLRIERGEELEGWCALLCRKV